MVDNGVQGSEGNTMSGSSSLKMSRRKNENFDCRTIIDYKLFSWTNDLKTGGGGTNAIQNLYCIILS